MHLIVLILALHWLESPEWVAYKEVADRFPCCGHHLCNLRRLLQWLQQDQETLQSGRIATEHDNWWNSHETKMEMFVRKQYETGWLPMSLMCGTNVNFLMIHSCGRADSGVILLLWTACMILWHVGNGVCRRWPVRPYGGWWWSTSKQWCRKESPLKMLMREGKEQIGWSKRLISLNSSSENWLL